ncbi:MAG: DUF3098 domain-containing protein [Chitinophagales bacterium]|nr:DUF3098 domain-containing protein [Chitinophagales bacterium]
MAKQIAKGKPEKTGRYEPQKSSLNSLPFVFDKTNYVLMVAGVIVILIGFVLMTGGATSDPNVFPADEIYSFRRITLAPIVVMIGFAIEIVAILKKPAQP